MIDGPFNARCSLPFDEMLSCFQRSVRHAFAPARRGLAFNVMSKSVHWEREDRFHVPFDLVASFLARAVSRQLVCRDDDGLYEYATYVCREPRA